jgi:hypothetical protein
MEESIVCEEIDECHTVDGITGEEDYLDEYLNDQVNLGGADMINAYQASDESFENLENLRKELSNLREIVRMLRMMEK